jgi:hypothetical protein
MASRAETTKGPALGPLSSIVISERVLRVITPVSGLLPPALSIAPFASCYIVSAFVHTADLELSSESDWGTGFGPSTFSADPDYTCPKTNRVGKARIELSSQGVGMKIRSARILEPVRL